MKPTLAMLRALRNMAKGDHPFTHLSGQAASGGADKTAGALIRRDWMTRDFQITEAGRSALAQSSK